jgi:hypothetical protein
MLFLALLAPLLLPLEALVAAIILRCDAGAGKGNASCHRRDRVGNLKRHCHCYRVTDLLRC